MVEEVWSVRPKRVCCLLSSGSWRERTGLRVYDGEVSRALHQGRLSTSETWSFLVIGVMFVAEELLGGFRGGD
jgi:hypothetical protein